MTKREFHTWLMNRGEEYWDAVREHEEPKTIRETIPEDRFRDFILYWMIRLDIDVKDLAASIEPGEKLEHFLLQDENKDKDI